MRHFVVFCLALPLLALPWPLSAQVDHASLNGTVTAASSAVVPDATVEAVSAATGLHRRAVTSSAGLYQIPGLPVGMYTVTISKSGFRSTEYKEVEFVVKQARTIDAQLAVATSPLLSR